MMVTKADNMTFTTIQESIETATDEGLIDTRKALVIEASDARANDEDDHDIEIEIGMIEDELRSRGINF